MKVFNMNGQMVHLIANEKMESGSYHFTWDATEMTSGIYFIQSIIAGISKTQKVMLVK